MSRELKHRAEVIVDMLRWYREAQETLNGKSGVPGDGELPTVMPATWNESFRILERLLGRMREERRSQWWHVTERYTRASSALVTARVVRTRRGVEFRLPPHCELVAGQPSIKDGKATTVRVVRWSPSVREEKVRRGVAWLAAEWPAGREPFLPVEFLEAA